MRSKKIFTVLALLIIATLAFAACTGNVTTTQPTTTAVGETTTTAPPVVVGLPDLGGRVVRIVSAPNSNSGFIGRLNEDHTFYVPHPETTSDFHRLTLQFENRIRVEEMFNITIEPIAIGGWGVWDYIVAPGPWSGGEVLAEGVNQGTGSTIRSMIRSYIHPLERLADELPVELDLFTNNFFAWPCMVHAGYTWNMARPLPPMNNQGIVVNLDIIEAFGAPNPVELFERGLWTWDAMREVMIATTQDTTGDGNIDTWGLGGNLPAGLRHLLVSNDAYVIDPDTLQLNYTSPEAMAALEFIYEIIANGWWRPADPTVENPTNNSGANENSFELAVTALGMANTPGHINARRNADFHGNVTWVPFPIGPNNTSGLMGENGGRGGATVLNGAEDPHYVLWILDELFAWPGDEWFDVENQADVEWARRFMPDEESVQRLFNAGINQRVNVDGMNAQARICIGYRAGILGNYHRDMIASWWHGSMTVAQSVEYWAGYRQHLADEFFGDWEVPTPVR